MLNAPGSVWTHSRAVGVVDWRLTDDQRPTTALTDDSLPTFATLRQAVADEEQGAAGAQLELELGQGQGPPQSYQT